MQLPSSLARTRGLLNAERLRCKAINPKVTRQLTPRLTPRPLRNALRTSAIGQAAAPRISIVKFSCNYAPEEYVGRNSRELLFKTKLFLQLSSESRVRTHTGRPQGTIGG